MASFMGRAGAGAGAASRALDPLRSRLRPSGSQRTYLSISHLRSLHIELVSLLYSAGATSATPSPSSSGDTPTLSAKQNRRLVEILRSIAEVVAFGEAGGKPEYFEFFCEKSTMALFVNALRLGPAIKTQVVQATSILFQNLRSPTSLYMLLSQDHINNLIQPAEGGAELPLDDEEFLTNYVALLKMISVRLSKDTVQFFFNAPNRCFPLYSRSVPLIGHPDPMVRTSALNIVLHVLSVQDPSVTAFLALEENHRGFFHQMSYLMQDAYSQILCRMWQVAEPSLGESTAIDGATSFLQDMFYFVQDVLSVGGPLLSEKLALHLFRTFFRPVVLEGLVDGSESMMAAGAGVEGAIVMEEREPELQLALYALCQFFVLTTEGPLLALVAAELFGQGGATAAAAAAAAPVAVATVDDNDDRRASTPPPPPHGAEPPATAAAAEVVGTSREGAVGLANGPGRDDVGAPVGGGDSGKSGSFVNGDGETTGHDETRGGWGSSGSNSSDGSGGDPVSVDDGRVEVGVDGPDGVGSKAGVDSGSGAGGSGDRNDLETDGDVDGDGDETNTVEEKASTVGGKTSTATPPPSPPRAEDGTAEGEERSHRPEGNRYQRALLSCVAWRRQQLGGSGVAGGGGAQVRLGAIAVLRSAVKNPSAAAEIVLGGAAAASITATEKPATAGGSGGGGSEANASSRRTRASAAQQKPSAMIATLDELTRGLSPDHDRGVAVDGAGGSGGGRQEMLSAASHGAADGGGAPSVLDFLLPDAHGQGRPKALSTTAMGRSAPGRPAERPSVLDFSLPGCTSPPAPALSRPKSYHAAGIKESAKPAPGPKGPPPQNDGVGPRPSKYLPRLERLWNGGALLFSERSDSSSGGGGGGGSGSGGDGRGSGSGAGASEGGAGPAGWRQRSESFEQVMLRLLEALTEPPAADTVAVQTAAAAVEELCVLEMYSWGNKGSGDSSGNIIGGGEAVRARTHASVVGDPALQALPRGGLWGPGTRNQRFAAMLTDAYARAAESLLSTTTRLYPFALLAACEQAVELLGFGSFTSDGDFRVSSPHPRLADVAGAVLRLGGGGPTTRIGGGGGGRGRGRDSMSSLGGDEGGELPAILVQNFLVLRSLHQWLVEGRTPLSGRQGAAAAAAAAPHDFPPLAAASAESLSTLELLSLPGSVRVDGEFIGLVAAAAGGDGGGAEGGGRGDTAGIYLFPSATSTPHKKAAPGASVTKEKEALGATVGGDPSAAAVIAATKTLPANGEEGEERGRLVGSSSVSIAASIRGWYNWSGGIRRRDGGGAGGRGTGKLGPPRPGDRVRLTDKNYVACYLPFNWPGKPATAAPKLADGSAGGGGAWVVGGLYRTLLSGYSYWTTPTPAATAASGGVDGAGGALSGAIATTNGGGRSSTGSTGGDYARHRRASSAASSTTTGGGGGANADANALSLDELYVVLDERSFMIAVPDPDAPADADGGLLVCVAPLRNTAAKKHPANPRVLELRVSTKEEGRAGSKGGPGLFLPVPGGGEAVAVAEAAGGEGGASFRGAGHRGIWHLVLSFQNPAACRLVAESVEEKRGAALAFPTVGLVDMLRRVASMSSSAGGTSGISGGTANAGSFVK
eukprot:g17188.t1